MFFCIGMWDPKGYGFSAVLAINRVSIKGFILVRLKRFQIYPRYSFPAQQHPSFGNQHILNFEVMAVRDNAKIAFVEKYTLIS